MPLLGGRLGQGVLLLAAALRGSGLRSRPLIISGSPLPQPPSSSRSLYFFPSSSRHIHTPPGSIASSPARAVQQTRTASLAVTSPSFPATTVASAASRRQQQPVRMGSTVASLALPRLPLFEAISQHDPASTAVVHCLSGRSFTYGELLPDVCRARERLYNAAGRSDIEGERVAFLVENSYDYVVTFLAILAARAVALPLSPPFPAPELQYIISHAEALLFVHSPKFASKVAEVLSTPWPEASPNPNPKVVEMPKHPGTSSSSSSSSSRPAYREPVELSEGSSAGGAAMMLYTSGTTNRPKGVLIPESALTAQSAALMRAWRYTPRDRLLHVLPLHHIHGTVNAVITPLLAGSTVEFLFPFNADAVWRRLASPFLPAPPPPTARRRPRKGKITFFTVVPTVYTRLISTHKLMDPSSALAEACRTAVSPEHMRVSISGSAALPTPVKRAWRELSLGNVLLERYGMTEVGMALSCGLDFGDRVDGSVGWPLPGVEARLVETDDDVSGSGSGKSKVILPGEETDPATGKERQGEIQLRGANVFKEYWRNPAATAKEFVPADPGDANQARWFKTGDVAVRRPVPDSAAARGVSESGDWVGSSARPGHDTMYFILGRQSADIIKSGGEKVSALEVEREMLSLPEVSECAVLAVPSGKWGQKVGAVVILDKAFVEGGGSWKPMDMRRALKGRMAAYKIPQVLRVVDHIPRNAMGKINKKELVKAVFIDEFSGDEM
ncbi:malonyl-CoA/methylmalonyl-CoA synthetase [Microdochium nivale]|nr:malonyl-CoA/methylmalonyl-CoA synthetase [Microdochium nivale]